MRRDVWHECSIRTKGLRETEGARNQILYAVNSELELTLHLRAIMNRRTFLSRIALMLAGSSLAGCQNQPSTPTLNVRLLQNSVPIQVVEAFQRTQRRAQSGPYDLQLQPESQLDDIWTLLQKWHEQPLSELTDRPWWNEWWDRLWGKSEANDQRAELVTLGDAWLAPAIRSQLIQPLPSKGWQQWDQLPLRWQQLVKRDAQGAFDPNGKVWGAPYRWGTTVIAYRADKFKELGWQPLDWKDLWRAELKHQISLLDHPREVIGLTLKKLGHSYNTPSIDAISALKPTLHALHQQVKVYSSDTYLEPLITGDTWLAVGWSSDLMGIVARYPQIKVVVPQSGSALWADVWVKPRLAPTSSLSRSWIDFFWQPETAEQFSTFGRALSPLPRKPTPQEREHDFRWLENAVFDRCEFLEPLSQTSQSQYDSLWKQIRTTANA
jgi:putative spermidine/putrescine transport system substrate-binding protein